MLLPQYFPRAYTNSFSCLTCSTQHCVLVYFWGCLGDNFVLIYVPGLQLLKYFPCLVEKQRELSSLPHGELHEKCTLQGKAGTTGAFCFHLQPKALKYLPVVSAVTVNFSSFTFLHMYTKSNFLILPYRVIPVSVLM